MSDSDAERQRKLKAGRAKLMEFKQMKKKKKKEESLKVNQATNQHPNADQAGSTPVEAPRSSSQMSASREASREASIRHSDMDQDTENDAASLSSVGNSNPASPIPHEGGDMSYTSDSEYTSAEESYTYSDDGGVDSFVVANLERNELKNRVIELEENLRGKQAVLKELNKENYELRAKLQTFQTGSRQDSSPSPVLRKELENLQETLRENQKRLEDINKENHDMRTKLAHTSHDEKSTSPKLEEMQMTLDSKQQMLEALNFQNQELIKENNLLKARQREKSPDNSQTDSQVESLQESLKTKQMVLSELNKQNEDLREKIQELSQTGNADNQIQMYKRKLGDLQTEIGLKDDEIERLKAVEISFIQTKELMKELSMQANQTNEENERLKKRCNELEAENKLKETENEQKISAAKAQIEKVQTEYHNIVALNNDHLMKIQILESQITTLDNKLEEKEKKIGEYDAQLSLAIGERDAVQLEARTQVEDFEAKIKVMQEQLQKNGNSIRDYEAEIAKASKELAATKDVIVQSERIVDDKNQQIVLLEKKLEVVTTNQTQFSNERSIYLEEIECLKLNIEKNQREIADLNAKLNESHIQMQSMVTEKNAKFDELEKEKIAIEKLKTEEVDNLQAHFDSLLKEQREESNRRFESTIAKLKSENEDALKDERQKFDFELQQMKVEFERRREAEIKELHDGLESEQRVKIEAAQEEVMKTAVQQTAVEMEELLKEKEKQIKTYGDTVNAQMKDLEELKHMYTEKCNELGELKEKMKLEIESNEKAKEELKKEISHSEERVNNLNAALTEVALEKDNLINEISLLRENEEVMKKKQELLEKENEKVNDELVRIMEEKEKAGKMIQELMHDHERMKDKFEMMTNEKNENRKEYEAELQMLKNKIELIKTENNDEMIEGFNKSMERMKHDKDEQIRNLKEEIAHIKDGNDKYVQKMQSDFESDLKHVEDENQNLKMELTRLKEAKEKEIMALENGLQIELESAKEKHKTELSDLKSRLEREFESEQLKLKESQWQQMRRYEAERELEVKRLMDEGEKNRLEAVELLRQQLEEEKSREIHDVVCNMTKEHKESEAELKAEMETQAKNVQEERDAELRNMKQEYNAFKETKRLEMEDLVSSQISKYQEEQETLQKRLNKAEGRVRKLMNEKEEFSTQNNGIKKELEELKGKLSKAEEELGSLSTVNESLMEQLKANENQIENERRISQEKEITLESKSQALMPLKNLFEDMRKEIHNLSVEGEEGLPLNRSDERVLGRSIDQLPSEELVETSLEKELSEITRLCKGEIIDLAYKLKSLKRRYEDRDKEFSEVSFLNRTLKEEVDKLEIELRNTQESIADSGNVTKGPMFPEMENISKDSPQRSFDIIDGKLPVSNAEYMTEKLQELAAEVEMKQKMKEELDNSLLEVKSEIIRIKGENRKPDAIIVEEVPVLSIQHEEAMLVPEVLDELETIPVSEVDTTDYPVKAKDEKVGTLEKEEAIPKDADLEIKHLQKLLLDNNEKIEKQKKEIKELRDALENERVLFAEQLRARVTKENEARESYENRSAETAMRYKRELMNKIASMEQRLIDKERSENELKTENWRLVNLLKDNSGEMLSEKELLQEQLEKQEEIIKEMQQQMSTGDLVSNDIQEAFGRQLAALHRQRDALIEQLEQHKRDHQGYAKVVQEKAELEERLREEKTILTEKLRQKEDLEMELSFQRSALNEKLIELEKLREMLNGKEILTNELAEQRDLLKVELNAVEDRLRLKEEDLSYEKEELERELLAKDNELRKWEEDFKAREIEIIEHEESLRQNFSEVLIATRNDFEMRNEENLRQLRTDLDSDYRQRIEVVETGLHDRYGNEITRLREDHDNQMSRAKGEFEERLLNLRKQLEEERLRQVQTMKNVLEREHQREMMDLGKGCDDDDLDELRKELEENQRLEIERIKKDYEEMQRRIMEDIQASLITESAIRVGAARLGAEQEVERQLQQMQKEFDRRLADMLKEIEDEKQKEIKETKEKCNKEMQEKVDEVMRDMQAEKEAEISRLFGENSVEDKIRYFESQISNWRDPQRIQASIELNTRHENEMEKVKAELVQKCGDDDEMFHALGEFESVQENYFQERLKYVQEEHEVHIENIVKDYEVLLLKTKNELDVLREDDFQRIRLLQDQIYAKEEEVLEVKKSLEDAVEKYEKELKDEKNRHDREIARKIDDQIALLTKEKEVWENDKQREMAHLKMQFDGWIVQKDHELEMRTQEIRATYENEMMRREMEFIQREEIIKANYGQDQIEARIQVLENQHTRELREQDAKHREELEQAVIQLSANLKQDFNNVMADMKASHEEEKMQMRKDFKKVKRDALEDLREELAVDYNIQLKEMRAEIEHNKVADIAKATTQISMKNAVDLENLRNDLTSKYEKEIDAIKKELQKDFELNALRQAAQIEEIEIRHAEELNNARKRLSDNEREAIRRDLEKEFARSVTSHAEQIEELEMRHAEELRYFREEYEQEEVGAVRREIQGDLAHNAMQLAQQMEELESKHAEEMKRLRLKYERDEVDNLRQEMREEDLGRRSTKQSDDIREIELKHEEDLKHIKERYELLLTEKTQELQSEVNVLKSLLEGSQKQLHKISKDFVDAVPTAPPFHEMPGSVESLIVPRHEYTEGMTPAGSTETLIARFRDGDVVNALNDAYRSYDDVSRTGTSLSGSVPSLFQPPGRTHYPVARSEEGHDEVEQNREAVISAMRRKYRPSDSDSGRSYDQMMEPMIMEDEEGMNKFLREKEDEMRARLAKQKEDLESLYEQRIHELEKYIHSLQAKHDYDVKSLKERSLQLAEEKLNEVREEAAVEKVHLQKEAYLKLESSQKELNEKNENLLKQFMKEQEKMTEELKNEHIDELNMLKNELTMKHEKELKSIGEKQSQYVLETRDRYEKLLKDERTKFEKKHSEDAKKLKALMEKNLKEREKDLVNAIKEEYESDLKHAKQCLEDDRRRIIDELTKDHMVEIERIKENQRHDLEEKFESEKEEIRENARKEYDNYLRRDLTERVYFEIERARDEARKEYHEKMQRLENQIEDLHVKQLQTLQSVRESHKGSIDELKRQHQDEMEQAERINEEKMQALKDSLQEERRVESSAIEENVEKDFQKLKDDLEELHSKELDDLSKDLTAAKAKLAALEEAKSVTEKTYTDTIQKLHEDYENEIGKLKKAVEKYRHEELEKHDRNVSEIYNTDQRIIKQNFEQQLSELKKHYELMLSDLEKKFEVEKREWLEQNVDKYEKKVEKIKEMYEEERKELHNEIINLDDEHTKQMDSLMDKIKSLTAELNAANKKTTQLSNENVELTNKVKIVNDQYNTLVGRHERQEGENAKYIKMISSDVEKCEKEKSDLRQGNERLLQTLSNAIRGSILIEDMINRQLDNLIHETSKTESDHDDGGGAGNGRRRGNDTGLRARFFGGSPSKSKKDKTLGDSDLADWTQYSNLSGGSLLSDEGLDLSFISKDKLFTGPELDANSEEIVRAAGERLHSAVEHLLRMFSVATRQTNEARHAYEEAVTRTSEVEDHQQRMRDEIAEKLKKALEDLEKEGKMKQDWENDARKKNALVHKMEKEHDELKQKIEEVKKENKEKDDILRSAEERCLELESEKEILVKLKNDLELKLAEFKTHRDESTHELKRENEDLKLRLAKTSEITGDELNDVLAEIVDLKEKLDVITDEKEKVQEQMKEAKLKEANVTKQNEVLKQSNIEILQTNKELLEQNEALLIKSKTLESALEETLEEMRVPQEEADPTELICDDVDGGVSTSDNTPPSEPPKNPPRGTGSSPNKDVLLLQEEIRELKDDIDILKEKNEMLYVELDKKHETELDLLNKISELEDELYRSAQEGFESEMDDKETLIKRRKGVELNLKRAIAENEKLKEDLTKKEEELNSIQADLKKAKDLVADRQSIFDELKDTKTLLSEKDSEFSRLILETDQIKENLLYKEKELTATSLEICDLRETVTDQRSTIENQDKKILDLLENQKSGEKAEEYIQELVEEIHKEKEMVLEKDNEIQALLEKLDARRSQGDGEDSETKSKKMKMLQEELSQKELEIRKLKKVIDASDEKRQELEQNHEIRLQKTIHHIQAQMEEENERKIAELKAEHQAEIDRMLETSRIELTELGQQFEEQIGAAERVNLHLLENFFKNRTLNESQMPRYADEDTPVESLLNELQNEAEKIASLVTSYQLNGVDPSSIEELQNSWAKEKQILLEAVKALRELVAKATNIAASDASNVGEDWRTSLLKAIEEVFSLDADLLNAEIETLESIPAISEQSSDLISEKRKRLSDQQNSQILSSLNNKDRESLLKELGDYKSTVERLTQQVDHYRSLLEEIEAKADEREKQFTEIQSRSEEELEAASQLKDQLQQEQNRRLKLETELENEMISLADMKKSLNSKEENIKDLVNALETGQIELNTIREEMTKEQIKMNQLKKEVKTEKDRSEKLQKNLETERKYLEEMKLKGKTNIDELERLVQEKTDEQDGLIEKLNELTEEKNRLIKTSELEQTHSRKIESLCEEFKSKAAEEKVERERMEKTAERYQANLKEMTKLFEDEKERRIKSEAALIERSSYQAEAVEKGQLDAATNEKLEELLKGANEKVNALVNELEKAEEKIASQDAQIFSLQSESTLKIAEIKKQNAESISEMRDIVTKSKRDFADEIERERSNAKQLKESLKNLQLKYETSRSQYERLRQSFDEMCGDKDENTPKSSPRTPYSVSSRALDPFVNRCNKLVKHCQDVIVNEQQRMTYGADRPSERHIKELQSTHDALAALIQELDELQHDLRVLEQADQCDNSPIARLEQVHNKNEELRDHIRKLVKEKAEFRANLSSLEDQVMEYRKREAEIDETQKASREAELQLKSEQLMWEAQRNSLKSDLLKLEAERDALESSLNRASLENANLRNSQTRPDPESPNQDVNANKISSDSGWTIQKIQKLYGRCLRAESFRKALIYQKKYLLFLLGGFQETEAITLSMIAKMNNGPNTDGTARNESYGKSRAFMRFRTAARVVIATWRMKFLVKKWSKSVSKITLKSTKRDEGSNNSPSAPPEYLPERTASSSQLLYSQHTKSLSDQGVSDRQHETRRGRQNMRGTEQRSKRMQNGQAQEKPYEYRRDRNKEHENIRSRPRMQRYEKIESDSEPSSDVATRDVDVSPPRAYPRPASPKRRGSPSTNDTELRYLNTRHSSRASSRSRSPSSQGPSPNRTVGNKHERSMSASGLEDTNTSLNAYIKKLEMLQARLKSQGADSGSADSRRF